jgi:hypothetical protein
MSIRTLNSPARSSPVKSAEVLNFRGRIFEINEEESQHLISQKPGDDMITPAFEEMLLQTSQHD